MAFVPTCARFMVFTATWARRKQMYGFYGSSYCLDTQCIVFMVLYATVDLVS